MVEVEVAGDASEDARTGDDNLGSEGRNAVADAVHDGDEGLRVDGADGFDVLCEENFEEDEDGSLVFGPFLKVRERREERERREI